MLNTEANILPVPENEIWNIELNRQKASHAKAVKRLKKGIWLYFWLLIFEGALRKWILPGLAAPLLIVRDPIAIWVLIYGYAHGMLKINNWVVTTFLVGTVAMLTTMLVGHGNMSIALFGLRIFFIHFPIIFIIGRTFSYQDVESIGKAMLFITPFMTALMIAQFYSPQTAWVNKGIGGTEGGGFAGVGEYFRPPGTFSFISGLSAFYGFTSTFICYFWISNSRAVKQWLLIIATVCLLAAIPFSISRTLFFQVCLSVLFTFVIAAQQPKVLKKMLLGFFALTTLIYVLGSTGFIKTGTEVFTTRFETANKVEGGAQGVFLDRFLGGLLRSISGSGSLPFFGYGLGLGTNVGAKLLTGKVGFLFDSEGEWGRLIGEMGIVLGLIFIWVRLNFTFKLIKQAWLKIRTKNYLPWLITAYAFLNIIQGQWGQPSSLGFSVFSSGLIIAAFTKKKALQLS